MSEQNVSILPTAPELLDGPCTAVLVYLTLKSGIDPRQVMPHMTAEVRDTVKLYLTGKIAHWYSQCDAPGVVFLFHANTIEAVQDLMTALPLVKEDLVDLQFTRLGPLMPLKILLGASGAP